MSTALERSWYRRCGWSLALAPLSLLYGAVVRLRRLAYKQGWLHSERMPVPVIVIGNITVGGSGKTPLTVHIAEYLHGRGLNVGIVSRGYGGRAPHYPLHVTADTPAAPCGDEPLLLALRGHAAVMVDPQRPRAARRLVDEYGVDIILADDGLQHYALQRDIEIAVVDGERGYGNGWLLPAGPLREPRSRLAEVTLQLEQGAAGDFTLQPQAVQSLLDGRSCALADFPHKRVHALAGIGAPDRFFDMLRAHGFDVIAHPFPDHHPFTAADIQFDDHRPVLMTEKDAVKCRALAAGKHWFVPVAAKMKPASAQRLQTALDTVLERSNSGSIEPT